MTLITQQYGYKVILNNGSTYLLVDSNDDCYGYFNTERKALNALKRTLKAAGKI